MSSKAEKEKRRQERLAAEEAARKQAERRKRLGLAGAVVLVAAIAVVVVLAVAGGGDDGESSAAAGDVEVPTFGADNLSEAAQAAGCDVTLEDLKEEGRGHTTEPVEYKTNPPTSGPHDPTPSQDGIYDESPDVEQSVHSLEHGRIHFQYAPGSPPERVAQLEAMASTTSVKGTEGYHALVYPNGTEMEAAVAATAWQRSITCPEWNDRVFDAFKLFWRENVDKAPEFIP
jgi:hypothetical protein